MDTPEKPPQHPPGLENSPTFSFINNLSPIQQPVKSVYSNKSVGSLNFDSISSIFTSPHSNVHKESRFSMRQPLSDLNFDSVPSIFTSPHGNVPKESRFCTRKPLSDLSNPQFSSLNGNDTDLCMGISSTITLTESVVTASGDQKMEGFVDLSEKCLRDSSIPYDCGSPNHNTSFVRVEANHKLVLGGASFELVDDVLDARNIQVASGLLLEWKHHEEESMTLQHDKKTTEVLQQEETSKAFQHEWDSLICNRSLSIGHRDFLDVPWRSSSEDIVDVATDCTPVILSAHHDKPWTVNSGEVVEEVSRKDTDCTDCKVDSGHQRGMRRRSLAFEMAGAHMKSMHTLSSRKLSTLMPCHAKFSKIQQATSSKDGVDLSRCLLHGVGLHLNSLATISNSIIAENNPALGKKFAGIPCTSTTNLCPYPNDQEEMQTTLSHETDPGSSSSILEFQIMQDSQNNNLLFEADDQSHTSPRKKRRKAENSKESEGCKRCNCKKSKCLKLYCECFAAGVYCVEPCTCQGCFNKPIHEDTVLSTRKQIESRNPLAFAPKVIRASAMAATETGEEISKSTPSSSRHKRGCNCKKSNCLKKYCECFQGGVGCSIGCRCEGCKNTFGRRDGSSPLDIDASEQDKEESACAMDRTVDLPDCPQSSILLHGQCSENSILITPSLMHRPFSSGGKPQRAVFSLGSSIVLNTCASLSANDTALLDQKLTKSLTVTSNDEASEVPGDICSSTPLCTVKAVSPNCKRVTAPHNECQLSPTARKGCRKLILKSIPPFPLLSSETTEFPTDLAGTSFDPPSRY